MWVIARALGPAEVYDVTSFLSLHPGGGQLVVDAAAQDPKGLGEGHCLAVLLGLSLSSISFLALHFVKPGCYLPFRADAW